MAARKQPQDHLPSVRDQLRQKRQRESVFKIHNGEDSAEKQDRLDKAKQVLQYATLGVGLKVDAAGKAKLKREVDKLQAEYDAECLVFRFRGLSPAEWDTLDSEFAVPELTDEEKAEGKEPEKFRRDRYIAALLAVSAMDSDLSVDDWYEEITSGRWSVQEVAGLREAAVTATHGEPAGGIPKG
ncbi:hypothetical protein [Streptomyces sp.]|uniref:hypothetical protein n=1 Tax=Streptomyces sp. TaxID=1931 RepID=UPI002F930E9F